MDYGLRDKTVLVTGVSRTNGIGAAVARAFAGEGANIFTTYFRPYDGDGDSQEPIGLIEELRRMNVKAVGLEADLSDPATPASLFDFAERELGIVDVLVNNACHDVSTDLFGMTAEILDKHYAVNLRGTALLCAEFAKRYHGRPGGRIINLTSGQGLHPMPDNLPYALTKGAIETLTSSISPALAKQNITVNAVDPGATDSGWISAKPDLHRELTQKCPMGRVGLPDDAARLILFLGSEQAQWIAGQVLHSRGGL
jgi:3-oxoacyl-[acyl-carrier protein] reductase